jgi:hypothetical protein
LNIENKSHIEESTGELVLRSYDFPEKNSKMLFVTGDSIEIMVVDNEKRNQSFLISDITIVRLKNRKPTINMDFYIEENGINKYIPGIDCFKSTYIDTARRIYEYIIERNPNISFRNAFDFSDPVLSLSDVSEDNGELIANHVDAIDIKAQKAPGRTYLRAVGIIYILISAIYIFAMFEFGFIFFMRVFYYLVMGINGIHKSNNLVKAETLNTLTYLNFVLVGGVISICSGISNIINRNLQDSSSECFCLG